MKKSKSKTISLFFGWNNIGSEGALALAELFAVKNIERFSIENCNIGMEGITKLATAIESKENKMSLLNMSGNNIGDNGAKVLSPALSKSFKIILESNKLTHEGINAFPNLYGLISINLYGNNIGKKGTQAITGRLKPGFRKLTLEKCGIGDDGAIYVSHALCKCETMQLISLSI